MIRLLLLLVGALGIANTLLTSAMSHLNFGVLLPALLGTPLLIVGLFLPGLKRFSENGFGGICKWVFFAGYTVLFLAFAITFLVIGRAAHEDVPENADVLIVLGAGLRGETPSWVLRNRLNTAKLYLDENPHTVAIVSGGQGKGEQIAEATAMARYLRNAGIPEHRIILEDASTSTQENFAFSQTIIQERWGAAATVVFVTTDFHVYRAGRVAQKQGIHATGIAAPDVWYIAINNLLRESTAIWAYAVTGVI